MINQAPYNTDMTRDQFADIWARNQSMVVYLQDGSPAIPCHNFKVKFAKARGIKNLEDFISAFVAACNESNKTMSEYINDNYDHVVLGK
jgi:hypothetical protein